MNEPPVRGVVVGHGAMAEGLVDAVRQITGAGEETLIAVSNRGLSPEALTDRIAETVAHGPVIVFTDLQTGSCGLAARRCCQRHNAPIVTGVNLPLLLDFVVHRDLPFDELVRRLVEKGRDAIQAVAPPEADGRRAVQGG